MLQRALNQAYETSSWERVQYIPNEEFKELEKKIAADPDNAQLWLEKGLLFADSMLYREAGECYAHAIALEPFNGILYRHWAHRMLSQWRFEDACAGFVIASRLIPENWDVWYHLGLSYFLLQQYDKAALAYQHCLESTNREDLLVAVCDWYYMTEIRRGNREGAAKILEYIHEDFDPGENTAYFRRLLMYKGIIAPEDVLPKDLDSLDPLQLITMGFGLANYYYYNGEEEKSNQLLDLILDAGDKHEWYSAFGYLAAKVDKATRTGK